MRKIDLAEYRAKQAAYNLGLRVRVVYEPDPLKLFTMNKGFWRMIAREKAKKIKEGANG